MFNCFMLYVRLRTWEYHPGGPNPCTCRSRGMNDKFPFMILFSNQQLLLHACKHSLYENWNSCNFQECGTLERRHFEMCTEVLNQIWEHCTEAVETLHFHYCQQISRKNQNQQYVGPSLKAVRLPQPVCGSQCHAHLFLQVWIFELWS